MSADAASTAAPRRFRWLQVSLRTLLLIILVAGMGLGWYSRELRRRERIETAVRLLDLCPTPYDPDPNPLTLVRAVNFLRAIGKNDAIDALQRFNAQTSRHQRYRGPDSLRLVIPLLFDRIDAREEFPGWEVVQRENHSKIAYPELNFRISIVEEIPFRIDALGQYVHSQDESSLIDWAQRHGQLRQRPLHPGDEPLQAADTVISQCSDGGTDDERSFASNVFSENDVRDQALRCVSRLVELRRNDPHEIIHDDEWARLKNECHRLGIRWSEEQQQYVATKGRSDRCPPLPH